VRPTPDLYEPGQVVMYDGDWALRWISICKACGHEQNTFSRESHPRALPCAVCGGKKFRFLTPKTRQLGIFDCV